MEWFVILGGILLVVVLSWTFAARLDRKVFAMMQTKDLIKDEEKLLFLAKKAVEFAYECYYQGMLEISAVHPLAKAYALHVATTYYKEVEISLLMERVEEELIAYYSIPELSSLEPC